MTRPEIVYAITITITAPGTSTPAAAGLSESTAPPAQVARCQPQWTQSESVAQAVTARRPGRDSERVRGGQPAARCQAGSGLPSARRGWRPLSAQCQCHSQSLSLSLSLKHCVRPPSLSAQSQCQFHSRCTGSPSLADSLLPEPEPPAEAAIHGP